MDLSHSSFWQVNLHVFLLISCALYPVIQCIAASPDFSHPVTELVNPTPCTVQKDTAYGGAILDCSSKNIDAFHSDWLPADTTTIRLNDNQLTWLEPEAFAKAPQLRYLDLSSNSLTRLKPEWFRGIKEVEVFKVDFNLISLDSAHFSENVFGLLPSVKSLDLGYNNNDKIVEGTYPEFLIKDLHNLEDLALDTFALDLDFGSMFDNVTTLTRLKLTGGMRKITNESFRSFDRIPLESLRLQDLNLLIHTDQEAYRPLRSLKNLYIIKARQEINDTMLSLKPFENRHMVNLYFDRIGSSFKSMSAFEGGKVLDDRNGRYLRNICVENLSIVSSKILAISHDTLASDTLARCLRTFNAKNNPIYGEINTYFELVVFQNLTSILLSDNIIREPKIQTCVSTPSPIGFTDSGINPRQRNEEKSNPSYSRSSEMMTRYNHKEQSKTIKMNCSSHFTKNSSNVYQHISTKRCYRITKSLQYAFVVGKSNNLLKLDYFVGFWPNNLKTIYISDNGISNTSGQITGLHRLELLDISKNDASQMRYYFFDDFPSLKTLLVRNMNFNISFIALSSARLFGNLRRLENLDLTDNGLDFLSPDTFKTTGLKVLILSKNRFRSIPFQITNTPHLCLLNLSYNSISYLTLKEMNQLDKQAMRSGKCLSLQLEGNILSCSCSQFGFMRWIQTTPVRLDSDKNYLCMDDEGAFSKTSKFRDLDAFWRQCNGKVALYCSLIIFSLMTLAFTSALLVHHFKSRLLGYVHQVILRTVKPKRPCDYPVGVYIAYADQDATFACLPLRMFIENGLGLTTYVRHRDALANEHMDVAISEAINSCWRVLVVLTESYLTSDRWSFYTMKLASSSVTTTNQGKAVVLVQAGLEKKIPMCLLKAAEEDSIISVDTTRAFRDFEDDNFKTRLRKALTLEARS